MNTPRWTTGDKLCAADQKHVLSAFVHRFTREHKPHWTRNAYPVQHDSDQQWLATTRFAIRADGRLDNRVKRCESSPQWPDNPELRTKAA